MNPNLNSPLLFRPSICLCSVARDLSVVCVWSAPVAHDAFPSQRDLLCIYWIMQRHTTWERNEECYSIERFSSFTRRNLLTPVDPEEHSKPQIPLTYIHMVLLTFMGYLLFVVSFSLLTVLQMIYNTYRFLWVRGIVRVHCLRLKLCIRLGDKSRLHGKSKA